MCGEIYGSLFIAAGKSLGTGSAILGGMNPMISNHASVLIAGKKTKKRDKTFKEKEEGLGNASCRGM
jgi:hypothetical protein